MPGKIICDDDHKPLKRIPAGPWKLKLPIVGATIVTAIGLSAPVATAATPHSKHPCPGHVIEHSRIAI